MPGTEVSSISKKCRNFIQKDFKTKPWRILFKGYRDFITELPKDFMLLL